MGCFKQLSIAASTLDQFSPLHSAVYLASTDKILGTMENFVVEFNPTTGAVIRAVKTLSPVLGPMWIGLVNGSPWVSARFDPADGFQVDSMDGHPFKDIFPISTTTLEVSGPGLIFSRGGVFLGSSSESYRGPHYFLGSGTKAFFLYDSGGSQTINYINTTNPIGDQILNEGIGGYWSEQFCTNGTRIYIPDPYNYQVVSFDMTIADFDFCETWGPPFVEADGRFAVATEWVSGTENKVYAVCGSKWLLRINTYFYADGSELYDEYDLDALIIASGVSGVKPMRLRYHSSENKLYIPCQNKDGVIVYDVAGGTAVWKSGFDSPVDVVFTPTKKFAVQSGLVGLKEIT